MLSGTKNFEGRLCDCVRANYLASPPLVVAYAIAGTVRIDFETEPLGKYFLTSSISASNACVEDVSASNAYAEEVPSRAFWHEEKAQLCLVLLIAKAKHPLN